MKIYDKDQNQKQLLNAQLQMKSNRKVEPQFFGGSQIKSSGSQNKVDQSFNNAISDFSESIKFDQIGKAPEATLPRPEKLPEDWMCELSQVIENLIRNSSTSKFIPKKELVQAIKQQINKEVDSPF